MICIFNSLHYIGLYKNLNNQNHSVFEINELCYYLFLNPLCRYTNNKQNRMARCTRRFRLHHCHPCCIGCRGQNLKNQKISPTELMLKSMFLRKKSVSRYFKEVVRHYNKQNDLMIRYTQTSQRYIVKPFSNRHITRKKRPQCERMELRS